MPCSSSARFEAWRKWMAFSPVVSIIDLSNKPKSLVYGVVSAPSSSTSLIPLSASFLSPVLTGTSMPSLPITSKTARDRNCWKRGCTSANQERKTQRTMRKRCMVCLWVCRLLGKHGKRKRCSRWWRFWMICFSMNLENLHIRVEMRGHVVRSESRCFRPRMSLFQWTKMDEWAPCSPERRWTCRWFENRLYHEQLDKKMGFCESLERGDLIE